MLHNYLVTALRNLARHRLYTAITVLGLGAAFAAAMLVGLYVRDEYSFERFISGYRQVYRLETDILTPGQKPQQSNGAAGTAAANLAPDFPGVEGVARLRRSSQWVGRGEAKSWERVAWADPDFFKVLPYPVLAGDPVAALHDPDGVVLTRQAARKFFGVDAPIGRTLQLQAVQGDDPLFTTPHPMVVRAVLKDVPSATHLEQFKIFASGRAPWSYLTWDDQHPSRYPGCWTYVRLRPGVPPDRVRAELPTFSARRYPGAIPWRFRLEPLKDLHLTGDTRAVDAGIATVGVLIILIAAINFVTLMTARAARRAVEVGVRKVAGARRSDLMIQFMGETLILVLAAMLIGVAIVEATLPAVDAFLRRTIALDFWDDPALAAAILGAALLTGLVAGLYPALVLSSFRPALALKGKGAQTGSAGGRQGLVTIQFAILICLMIVGATIWRQTSFALQNLLRLHEDQIVYFAECDRPFKQALAALPGVNGVACVSDEAAGGSPFKTLVKDPARGNIGIAIAAADVGFFEMHGLKPLAGRFFASDHGEDMVLERPGAGLESQPSVVVNESGVRQLGFRSAQDAVGKSVSWGRMSLTPETGALPLFRSSRIVGVVRDFALNPTRKPIEPTLYFVGPRTTDVLLAKLQGGRLPETLRAIDGLWRRVGHVRPIRTFFLDEDMRGDFRDVEVQGAIIGGSAGLAIVIACLGLFSMAAFTAERRTKEIGVRKAMGASAPDVVRLLLWQFTQPVLWANLAAWPLAFWAADHWLRGFAYRVSLPPWLFLSASAAALLIALGTVAAQAWTTARAKPVSALRYE